MEKPTRELVNGFLEWFQDHPHSAQEDHYAGTLTLENLSQMDRQQFIEFFYQFAYDGGHVQSRGHRTAPLASALPLRRNMTSSGLRGPSA